MEKAAEPYAVKLALRRMSAGFVKLYAVGCRVFTLRKGFERKSLAAAGVKDIDLSFWKPHGFLDKLYMLQIGREVAHFYTEQIHVFNWDGDKRSPLKDGIDIWKKYLKIFGGEKTLLLEFMPDDNIRSLPNEAEALRKITERLI